MRINIIGAGKVGKVIGRKLMDTGIASIGSVLNSTIENAKAAANFIGGGQAIASVKELADAEIQFIATPDERIREICDNAVSEKKFSENSIILHFSGVLDTHVLATAKKTGCFTARIHPIKHMYDVRQAFDTFQDVYCVYQGDDEAYDIINTIFTAINGIVIRMANQNNQAYHAAGVFAASYHQILAAAAAKLYESCGISHEDAMDLSIALAQTALTNTKQKKIYSEFVEGPVKRLDEKTIRQNQSSISDTEIAKIYESIGKFAITLTTHSEEEKDRIRQVLTKKEKE